MDESVCKMYNCNKIFIFNYNSRIGKPEEGSLINQPIAWFLGRN